MEKEEVVAEVEAVEAVYCDDCLVLEKYPPHLHVHIKPRTADVSSQQFVEATIGIRASSKYPDEPPRIAIVDSKGLDEQRQERLVSSICDNAAELTSCLMLVALCEGAVETLSSMNHPDGNCPLCLCPLVDEDDKLPFMKLMSCYHCFHCECIIRWWNWLRMKKEADDSNTSRSVKSLEDIEDQPGIDKITDENMGKCPVCRKPFLQKDIEHVLDLVETHSEVNAAETLVLDENNLLQSDSEKIRRQKIESILKLQQENNGLIEPKKHEVLLPGMFLPQTVATPSTSIDKKTKPENKTQAVNSRGIQSDSSNRPSTSKHKNFGSRKHIQRERNSGKHVRQWCKMLCMLEFALCILVHKRSFVRDSLTRLPVPVSQNFERM